MEVHLQILILSFCGVLLTPSTVSQDICTKTGACSCTNSKGTIDLTPLAKNDGTPAYSDQGDGGGQWYFSYNPCNQFTEGFGGCNSVAVCQTDQMGSYFNLGTQDTAAFSLDASNNVQIEYTATTDTQRTTYVSLICDPNTESSMAVTGENPPGSAIYFMTLTSKHCCASGATGPPPTQGPGGPGGGITVGSVLVIVFFALAFVYIIGGLVFQVFVRKASGKEMVPNYGLWSIVPGLIKDGMLFTFTCGRRKGYGNV